MGMMPARSLQLQHREQLSADIGNQNLLPHILLMVRH